MAHVAIINVRQSSNRNSRVCLIKACNSHTATFTGKPTGSAQFALMRPLPLHISPSKHASNLFKFAKQVQTGETIHKHEA